VTNDLRSKLSKTADNMSGGLTGWKAGALAAGLGLAASYLYVRAKTRQAEAENPPRGRFIKVDGVKLHYIERGSGPALVLLHGNGVLGSDFEHSGVLDKAAERYRVIAFDRPGYGYSGRPRTKIWTPQAQARLLHHALQQIGVDSAIVLGHSWGTLVALSMALEVPDFVRGLVLVSGYYYPSVRADVPVQAGPAIPLIGDVMRFTVSPLVTRMIWRPLTKGMFSPQPVSKRFDAMPVWMLLRPKQLRAGAAESALMVPAAASLMGRYADLKVPAVIMAGTKDKVVSFGHNSERLNERLADSELWLQPGLGHMLHYAVPDKVVEAIDTIAAKVGEATSLRNPRTEALARASESGT
jgi:pimeloyl-ACP methyl ester carboxylesterase